jgi:quercetin dioxygenase-like cupin family protein
MRFGNFVIALMAVGLGTSTFAQTQNTPRGASPGHVLIDPGAIKWQPLPPSWADGPPPAGYSLGQSEVAIIEGDPTKEGAPFVLRIRSTPGTQVPPHWHEIDENITVLSGVWCVGMGDKLDEHACRDMPAGSYIVLPKGMHHFAIAKGDVVQVHGVGPFRIHWVK